jgi:hypothetical protein
LHAVTDVILAHSLIRSLPQVDAERTGITGISWGGYLTCITAGLDDRFKLAVPVYGCGHLGEDSVWLPQFKKLGEAKAAEWLAAWDPSQYLGDAKMPMLWVDGTNDFAYPLDSLQKSYREPSGPRTLCTRVRMKHGHGGPGENPEEIHAFADAVLIGGKPLTRIVSEKHVPGPGEYVWVEATFESAVKVVKVEFNFTRDTGTWQQRKWETVEGKVEGDRAVGMARGGATAFYLNLIDERGLVVSTEHVELPPLKAGDVKLGQ